MISQKLVNDKIANRIGEIGFGIAFILAVPKLILGFITGSISLMADGTNNLMDSLASVITIIGMKMSKKPGDENHPYGHGRIEYITGFTISLLTALVGVEFFKKSLSAIFTPQVSEVSNIARFFLLASIFLKVAFALLNNQFFKQYKSTIFQANRQDALMDVIISSMVLISGYFFAKYPVLDAAIALLISIILLYSAYETLKDTISPLIGERPRDSDIQIIEKALGECDKIEGYHNLYIDRKSMGHAFGAVDVEVNPDYTVGKIHDLMEPIARKLWLENNIELVIHVEPSLVDDKREKIRKAVLEIEGVNGVFDIMLSDKNFITLEITEDEFHKKDAILLAVDEKLREMDGGEWIKEIIMAFDQEQA